MGNLNITGPQGNSYNGSINKLPGQKEFSFSGELTVNGKAGTVNGSRIKNTDGTVSQTGTFATANGKEGGFYFG